MIDSAEEFVCSLCDEEVSAKLREYVSMLERWTTKIDLIAPAERDDIFEKHILDSLLALTVLGESFLWNSLVDVGSGAGLPGVVAAAARGDCEVVLVEPREKRCHFLREVRRNLGLDNLEVVCAKVEQYKPEAPKEVLISRALGRVGLMMNSADFILVKGGRLAEMVGPSWELDPALEAQYPAFEFGGELSYELPSGAERRVAVWQKS